LFFSLDLGGGGRKGKKREESDAFPRFEMRNFTLELWKRTNSEGCLL